MNKPHRKISSAASDLLQSRANLLGVQLPPGAYDLIERYLIELEEYNEHTNLVAKADPELVIAHHVVDALTLLPVIEGLLPDGGNGKSLVDIGSGAGFPGMILAIALPKLKVALVDSVGKKTRFLADTAKELGLEDRVAVLTGRAEEFAHDRQYREKFDFATARAVGVVSLIAELTIPLLKPGGVLLVQKSRAQWEPEMEAAQHALQMLGVEVKSVSLPKVEATERDLLIAVFKKTKTTPRNLPRPTAQLKKPLV